MPAPAAQARSGIRDPTRNATISHGEMAFAAWLQPSGRTLWPNCVRMPVARPATTMKAMRRAVDSVGDRSLHLRSVAERVAGGQRGRPGPLGC